MFTLKPQVPHSWQGFLSWSVMGSIPPPRKRTRERWMRQRTLECQQGARWETLQLKGEPSSVGRGTPRGWRGAGGHGGHEIKMSESVKMELRHYQEAELRGGVWVLTPGSWVLYLCRPGGWFS